MFTRWIIISLWGLMVIFVGTSAVAEEQIDTHLVIVSDVSPSMAHTDPEARDRTAGQAELLRLAAMEETVWTGLVLFTHRIEKTLPVSGLSPDQRRLDAVIQEYEPKTVENSGTDLAIALRKGRELLDEASGRSPAQRMKAILLMSDGDYDRAREFLHGWRTGGAGASIWGEIEALKKEGIILFTVPITPIVYGKSGAGTPQQQADQQDRWQAGHDLLEQMARATGGQSFVRVPGRLDFAEIYRSAIRKSLGSSVTPRLDPQGRPYLHELHKSVVFVGRGLRGVTLPNGYQVSFPANSGVRREDRNIDPLGTEMTWRELDGVGMAIFRRPPVKLLGQARDAWVGWWQIEADEGPASVDVVAFGDLKLSWTPPLTTNYWPDESVPLEITLQSSLLQATTLPGDAAARLFKSLSCHAELRDESDVVIFQETDEFLDAGRFNMHLRFPRSGRFELHIAVRTDQQGAKHDLLHVTQPILVEE